MLFWLHRKANNLDPANWPIGGARLETIGNIVYGESLKSQTIRDGNNIFVGSL